MRFLADESCDFAVVRALREAGHDVVAAAEAFPRAEDSSLLVRALNEGRVLLTEDKDFGQLAYSGAQPSPGVVFFRFPARVRAGLAKAATDLVLGPLRRRATGPSSVWSFSGSLTARPADYSVRGDRRRGNAAPETEITH